MNRYVLTGLAAAALAGSVATPNRATAMPVGLELALLVDSSGSISPSDYTLQMEGYASAFENAGVRNAINSNPTGSIAVQMIQWSGTAQQSEVIGWTQVSPATSDAFADTIRGIAREFRCSTAPQAAMNFASTALTNAFDAPRQIMDVSGDGIGERNTIGRDAALAAGYDTINGLVISPQSTVLEYYETYVQGGVNPFVDVVSSFEEFDQAILDKLQQEIVIPVPGAVWMFGTALLALFGVKHREIFTRA